MMRTSPSRWLFLVACFSFAVLMNGAALNGPLAAAEFLPPTGGYLYQFEAIAGQDSPGTAPAAYDALDGTFGYGNNSDTWDGSQIGEGAGVAGGVSVINDSYIRVQDPGDPRDYGATDPSNRKVYVAHKLTGSSPTLLDDGATLHFRMRLPTPASPGPLDKQHPDGGAGIVDWPATGDGYQIHDNGKGNIGFRQSGGALISFSLAVPTDHAEVTEPGLITNHLNGTAASGDVDCGDAGTVNLLPLDVTEWHEFWITIEKGGAGTHVVTIYVDGDTSPATQFDVTAGTGDDIGDAYVSMGVGSTGQSGAFDVDYIRVAAGVEEPRVAAAVPSINAGGLAILLTAILLGGSVLLLSRRRTVPA